MLGREKVEKVFDHLYDEHGIGLTVFSPLKQGLLTWKYNRGSIPEGSRFRDSKDAWVLGTKGKFADGSFNAERRRRHPFDTHPLLYSPSKYTFDPAHPHALTFAILTFKLGLITTNPAFTRSHFLNNPANEETILNAMQELRLDVLLKPRVGLDAWRRWTVVAAEVGFWGQSAYWEERERDMERADAAWWGEVGRVGVVVERACYEVGMLRLRILFHGGRELLAGGRRCLRCEVRDGDGVEEEDAREKVDGRFWERYPRAVEWVVCETPVQERDSCSSTDGKQESCGGDDGMVERLESGEMGDIPFARQPDPRSREWTLKKKRIGDVSYMRELFQQGVNSSSSTPQQPETEVEEESVTADTASLDPTRKEAPLPVPDYRERHNWDHDDWAAYRRFWSTEPYSLDRMLDVWDMVRVAGRTVESLLLDMIQVEGLNAVLGGTERGVDNGMEEKAALEQGRERFRRMLDKHGVVWKAGRTVESMLLETIEVGGMQAVMEDVDDEDERQESNEADVDEMGDIPYRRELFQQGVNSSPATTHQNEGEDSAEVEPAPARNKQDSSTEVQELILQPGKTVEASLLNMIALGGIEGVMGDVKVAVEAEVAGDDSREMGDDTLSEAPFVVEEEAPSNREETPLSLINEASEPMSRGSSQGKENWGVIDPAAYNDFWNSKPEPLPPVPMDEAPVMTAVPSKPFEEEMADSDARREGFGDLFRQLPNVWGKPGKPNVKVPQMENREVSPAERGELEDMSLGMGEDEQAEDEVLRSGLHSLFDVESWNSEVYVAVRFPPAAMDGVHDVVTAHVKTPDDEMREDAIRRREERKLVFGRAKTALDRTKVTLPQSDRRKVLPLERRESEGEGFGMGDQVEAADEGLRRGQEGLFEGECTGTIMVKMGEVALSVAQKERKRLSEEKGQRTRQDAAIEVDAQVKRAWKKCITVLQKKGGEGNKGSGRQKMGEFKY